MNDYQSKKAFFDKILTIYGRKPVLEALEQNDLTIYKLHLADSNKPGGIIDDISALAQRRGIDVVYHDKKSLSRISRNSKQDQGVAADLIIETHISLSEFLQQHPSNFRLIALDRITNPQNLGMIVRSVAAGFVDGLLLPAKGCAALSPLVIKASAGALFKARIIHCDNLASALKQLQQQRARIITLSSHAEHSLYDAPVDGSLVYVLGNETDGVSKEIETLADTRLKIPMNNGVESLNVAVTAALLAFAKPLQQSKIAN